VSAGSPPRGLILAAPHSGSGKTIVTLGLLRALRRRGLAVAAAKAGPDYIDTAFLAAAAGSPCRTLDVWAMRRASLAAGATAAAAAIVLCEGAMGLFDGIGALGQGSTAELARITRWPVVLVVDATGMGASVAALVAGFARHRPDLALAGVIFNRIGSARHRDLLAAAIAAELPNLPILGTLPRDPGLALPSRHLGLVQAEEHRALEEILDRAAALVERHLDVVAVAALARPTILAPAPAPPPLAPLGQRIAVARDPAFAFAYESLLAGWREAGAELGFFSPLGDEAPAIDADAVYLPGGYPELHAQRLAANARFLGGVRAAAAQGAVIYGECGGYMVLGQCLIDADGARHAMAALLPLEASFAERRLHLGYRAARLLASGPLGAAGQEFRGHEFHYATITQEGAGEALFAASDGAGTPLGSAGRIAGKIMGSFLHLIDRAA
jgi:cobyrinic acid a,c-diamide synthase